MNHRSGDDMSNYDATLEELYTYNDDELFYRDYYHARKNPEDLVKFLAAHSAEEIRSRRLICPELFEVDISLQPESRFFSMDTNRNIWVEKHNRYSPIYSHAHEYFESFYVLSGSCFHEINGKLQCLPQGTFCMISPFTKHAIGVFDDSIVLNLMIQRSTFDEFFLTDIQIPSCITDFFLSNLYTSKNIMALTFQFEDDDLIELLLSILEEEKHEDHLTSRILNHLTSIFLARLVRRYGNPEHEIRVGIQIPPDSVWLRVLSYINENSSDVTLTSVSKAFHYTEEHCSRMIRSVTGKSFTQLVRDVRMHRAEILLSSTPLNMEDIGEKIGYESATAFIRVFKQTHNMTPKEYRRISTESDAAMDDEIDKNSVRLTEFKNGFYISGETEHEI